MGTPSSTLGPWLRKLYDNRRAKYRRLPPEQRMVDAIREILGLEPLYLPDNRDLAQWENGLPTYRESVD
jgi:hypothetical protein